MRSLAGAVPLKLFEYMACGKPVISTNLQGVDAVAHDIVQYCSSVEDYAEAITRLYEDETLRKRVGGEGEKLISTSYDWENITKKLEDMLVRAARGETSVKRYQAADAHGNKRDLTAHTQVIEWLQNRPKGVVDLLDKMRDESIVLNRQAKKSFFSEYGLEKFAGLPTESEVDESPKEESEFVILVVDNGKEDDS